MLRVSERLFDLLFLGAGIVQITDRNGEIVEEISLADSRNPVIALAWDKDGDNLAILQDNTPVVAMWNLSSKKIVPVESNLKDPTFLAWSQTGPQLAVGTQKGQVLIYNKQSKKKTPVVGKHSKRIGCGAWSKIGNKLVLGSDDKTITVSNDVGDTLLQTEVKNIPIAAVFTSLKNSRKASTKEEETVCSNLDGKSLILFNILDEKDDPIELTFGYSEASVNSRYGEIKHHICLEDGLILVGFSLGYLVVISTNAKELGQEKFSGKFHPSSLTTFAYNPHLKKVATAGDDGVRVIDIRDFKESKADFVSRDDLEDGRVNALSWTPDGSILTVATTSGNVYNFLAKMTLLSAKYKSSIGYLSSLRELSVVDVVRRGRSYEIPLKLEPAVIAIGAKHAAAGMNNKVYFHRLASQNVRDSRDRDSVGQVVNDREYPGTVREIQLNDGYAAVLTGAKATLHTIEMTAQSQEQTFPTREEGSYSRISCMALTDDFFFYGTEAGTVEMFYIHEWVPLAGCELRLDNNVKALHPNSTGTRVVVVDSQNQIFLFNPVSGGGVNQSITKFESAPSTISSVLWDLQDNNVIMIFDGTNLHTYVYIQYSMKGAFLTKLGPMSVSSDGEVRMTPDVVDLPASNVPLASSGGILTCQKPTGGLATIVHSYFDQLEETIKAVSRKPRNAEEERPDPKTLTARFCQCLALGKLESAWQTAIELNRRPIWLALSGKSMELLNVELAIRVYRQLGDAGMVASLQDLVHVEDRNLLAGHISLLFGDYNRAQELFLVSSYPLAALQMRRDLLQWDVALKLAQAFCSVQIPDICIRYGQQLELRGDSELALKMFENALNEQDGNGQNICPDSLVPTALMGIARCNLRLGNYRQGLRIANEHGDKTLFVECGDILQQQKQYAEAAVMHIKGEQFEKAAYVYTKYLIKADKTRINEAASLMDKVQNDQLNSNFAKVCAAAGRYDEAAKAYERAKDYDMVSNVMD
jgi:WD repeat-containing protein 19